MNTRRSSVVRFAASALLTAAFGLGAHAFAPTAFGCGVQGGGNCITKAVDTPDGTAATFLDQVRFAVDVLDFLLP